jgi:hypothetical protein
MFEGFDSEIAPPPERSPNVAAVSDQGPLLAGFPVHPAEKSGGPEGSQEKRWDLRLPSFRRKSSLVPPLSKTAREERAETKVRQR